MKSKTLFIIHICLFFVCTSVSAQTAADSLQWTSRYTKSSFSPLTTGDSPDFFYTIPPSAWRTVYGPGLPLYNTLYCSRPSTAAVIYHGAVLNDPFTGRFNLRFLPSDIIWGVGTGDMYKASGYPQSLHTLTRDIGMEKPYTRAYYHYTAGRESTIGATFGQPLFSGFQYYGGFSANKYNTETEGTHNTYNNMFFQADIKLYRDWHAVYSMIHSKADVLLPHDMPVPADTVQLTDPVQTTVSKNHIIHIINDSLKYRPDVSFHRQYTGYTFRSADSDTGYFVQSHKNTLAAAGQTYFLSLPVSIDTKYIFRATSVHDTITVSDSHWCTTVGTRVGLFSNTFAGLAVSPQMHPGNRFRIGYNFRLSYSLSPKGLSLNADLSHAYRTPSLSERSGIILFNVPVSSESLFNLAQVRQSYCSNEKLLPESHMSARLSASLQTGHFKGTVSFFNTRISEYIHPQLTQNGIMFNNNADGSFSGINSYIKAGFHGSSGIISSNRFMFEHSVPGLAPPNISGSTAIFYSIDLFKKDISALLSASVRYWDTFYLFDYTFGNSINTVKIPPNAFLNLKVLLTVMKYAHVSLEVSNITGVASKIQAHQYLPYRQFRVTVLWELFD